MGNSRRDSSNPIQSATSTIRHQYKLSPMENGDIRGRYELGKCNRYQPTSVFAHLTGATDPLIFLFFFSFFLLPFPWIVLHVKCLPSEGNGVTSFAINNAKRAFVVFHRNIIHSRTIRINCLYRVPTYLTFHRNHGRRNIQREIFEFQVFSFFFFFFFWFFPQKNWWKSDVARHLRWESPFFHVAFFL